MGQGKHNGKHFYPKESITRTSTSHNVRILGGYNIIIIVNEQNGFFSCCRCADGVFR